MGQRANLVIVRNGDWQLYYDHWCANRLDVELFWGPRLAVEFVEQLDPKDSPYWTDERWCEGAAIIDVDRHCLRFFSSGDWVYRNIPYRRAYLALMKETWPGWEIDWAHQGILSITRYLGLPDESFLIGSQTDVNAPIDGGSASDERFRILTEFPEDNLTLLTTTANGIARVGRVYGDDRSLMLGPAQFETLPEIDVSQSFAWEGEMPEGGVHVDFDRKSLNFWFAIDTPAVEERAAAGWPGWEINWLQDHYEEHLVLVHADVLLPNRPQSDLQVEILGRLRGNCHFEGKNILRELAPKLGATNINPASDEARSSVGEEAEKLRVLADLSRKLGVPDRH